MAETAVIISQNQLILVGKSLVVIPCIVQADATYQIDIHGVVVLLAKERDQVDHKVDVRSHVLVFVPKVLFAVDKATFVPSTINVQASAHDRSKERTETEAGSGREQLPVVVDVT